MLTELRIENFAIIQSLELIFKPGLTTFTGETGAGKSIMLDALVALLGGRVDTTLIRAEAERANLEAVFEIPEIHRAAILDLLEREDLLENPASVQIGREVRLNGRSTARINGRSVSVGLLRELGEFLVDIHGQSEHLSLLNVRRHVNLLDHFAGSQEKLDAYRKVYHELRRVQKELASLRQSEQDAVRKTDLLEYQAQEIENAQLKAEEEEDLRQERTRLANAENLSSLAQQALTLLDEGSTEVPSLTDMLGQVSQALDSLARIDAGQTSLAEGAILLNDTLAEISRDLRGYLENIEFNPRRLEQVEERLDLIQRLKRKYGGSIESALAFAQNARQELDTIAHATERIAELEIREAELLGRLGSTGLALSEQRREASQRLSAAVEAELNDLSMAGARFSVDIQFDPDPNGVPLPEDSQEQAGHASFAPLAPLGSRVAFDESGLDNIEFLIAPNPGEGLKPLVKIASGGETSRLMLALKKVLTEADSIPTLIFDEIDQGIGGRVGSVVGEKLWQLARQHQVLCVTHLPQLAAFGDQHFNVRKGVEGGRTTTHVERLDGEARLIELAQMLGAVTNANLNAARETLENARSRAYLLSASKSH